jgi:hypothetical protein
MTRFVNVRFAVALVAVLCVTLSVHADPANLTTMSHRIEGTNLRVEFSYSAPPTGAKFYYQKYLKSQQLGTATPKDPAPESNGNVVVLLLPRDTVSDSDAVGVSAQTSDPGAARSPELRISLDEFTRLDAAAKGDLKNASLTASLEAANTDIARLTAENSELKNILTNKAAGIAHGVQYVDTPAVYPDAAVVHFHSTTAGRLRVTITDDKQPPNQTQRTADSDFTKEHTVRFDDLPSGTYTVSAWPLDVQGNIISAEKVEKDRDGRAIKFTTRSTVLPIQIDPIIVANTSENSISINVTSPAAQQSALVSAELYRVGEEPVVQAKGDDLKLPPNTLPSKLATVWPRSYTFANLTPGTQYRVVVTAMNELGVKTNRETTTATQAAFDFAGDIDVNITPAGYILSWSANADPKPNPNGAEPLNGFRLVFNNGSSTPVTSVPATIKGKELAASLNVAGLQQLLRPQDNDAAKDQPHLEVFMTSAAGKPVTRELWVHFDRPTATTLDKLNLTPADKQKMQSAIDNAGGGRALLQRSFWSRVWQQGLKAIIAAL